jgi:hypothetical protein
VLQASRWPPGRLPQLRPGRTSCSRCSSRQRALELRLRLRLRRSSRLPLGAPPAAAALAGCGTCAPAAASDGRHWSASHAPPASQWRPVPPPPATGCAPTGAAAGADSVVLGAAARARARPSSRVFSVVMLCHTPSRAIGKRVPRAPAARQRTLTDCSRHELGGSQGWGQGQGGAVLSP